MPLTISATFAEPGYDTGFAGDLGESGCGGPGDWLGKVEELDVFALAEVLSTKKLGQTDDIGAAFCRVADMCDGRLKIGVGVGAHSHLHQADFVFAVVFHFD